MKIHRFATCESLYDMPLKVQFVMTNMCNYDCSYCFGHSKIDKRNSDFPTIQQLQTAVNHLVELKRSHYELFISGGECTYHPNLLEFIQYACDSLQDKLKVINITSNGSSNVEIYSRLADLANQNNVPLDLMISIHTEQVSMKHIVELTKAVSKKLHFLHFVLMFNPLKKDYVKEIYEMMLSLRREDYPFLLAVIKLLAPPFFLEDDPRYSQEDYLWMNQANKHFKAVAKQNFLEEGIWSIGKPIIFGEHNGKCVSITDYDIEEFDRLRLADFRDMYCIHGSNFLNIFTNGACEGLVCPIMWNRSDRLKYNIFKSNPYKSGEFIYGIKCVIENCPCSGHNYWNPKFRNETEAANFVKIIRRKQARLLRESSN